MPLRRASRGLVALLFLVGPACSSSRPERATSTESACEDEGRACACDDGADEGTSRCVGARSVCDCRDERRRRERARRRRRATRAARVSGATRALAATPAHGTPGRGATPAATRARMRDVPPAPTASRPADPRTAIRQSPRSRLRASRAACRVSASEARLPRSRSAVGTSSSPTRAHTRARAR